MNKHIIQLGKVLYRDEIYYSAVLKNVYLRYDLINILREIGEEIIAWDDTIIFSEAGLFHVEIHTDICFEVIPDA